MRRLTSESESPSLTMTQLIENRFVFPDIMYYLNRQRREETLTDVNIIVGNRQISAHKCVLVAGSEYFESLYLGPLAEDKSEVNLSDVTDDYECTAAVIDFLYTGEIEIDDEKLDGILKIGSFLLISLLRESCVKYIEKNLNFDTCIQYYLISVDYMLPDLVDKLSKTVSSRFHDCLIFKDSTISVSPKQLQYLVNKCDIFAHCSTTDIISFVYEWTVTDISEEKRQVGSDILDYVSTLSTQVDARTCDILEQRRKIFVGDSEQHQNDIGNSEFNSKLNNVIMSFLNESKKENHSPASLDSVIEIVFAIFWSHDQDDRHDHIW